MCLKALVRLAPALSRAELLTCASDIVGSSAAHSLLQHRLSSSPSSASTCGSQDRPANGETGGGTSLSLDSCTLTNYHLDRDVGSQTSGSRNIYRKLVSPQEASSNITSQPQPNLLRHPPPLPRTTGLFFSRQLSPPKTGPDAGFLRRLSSQSEEIWTSTEVAASPVEEALVEVTSDADNADALLATTPDSSAMSNRPLDATLPPTDDFVLDEPQDPALEITAEARAMFHHVYREIVTLVGGEDKLAPPKEIVWLNGAPGAGKGANTPFILQTRGFEARAIQVSDLLAGNSDVAAVMASGGLVSDSMVLRLVLEKILTLGACPVFNNDANHAGIHDDGDSVAGAVVDGFPRTTLQVDFIKLLHDSLMVLHQRFLNTPLEHKFPRPIFRIAVLYVEEEESVRRQIGRGRAAIAHNQRVNDSGIGEMVEVRPTDLCQRSARRRYKIFKQHYDTLLRLKAFFPFHLIDGMGTLAECREQIEKELQYQSALELNASTFHAISHIPLASDIAKQARQNMVARLDGYQAHEPELFKQVIDIIGTDVVPIIKRSALAGIALFNTENPVFFSNPIAAEMLADIMSERGYSVTWQTRTREIPLRLDPSTYNIICTRKTSMQFRIKFERPQLRTSGFGVRSSIASSLLAPRPEAVAQGQENGEGGPKIQPSGGVCQNIRPDGFPACFEPGEGEGKGEEGSDGSRGVEIPGLPLRGRIVRDAGCPPLPEWTSKQLQ